jgi:alkylation response protein AidB-like acyl-CoA dehydrogenase
MDFAFSKAEEIFRREVDDFFINEERVVSSAREEWDSGTGYGPYCWELLRKIGKKGWLCPTWPKEFGALGLPYIYRYIVQERMY